MTDLENRPQHYGQGTEGGTELADSAATVTTPERQGASAVRRFVVRVADRSLIYLVAAAFILVAQVVISAADIPSYVLPTPLEVWYALIENFVSRLWPDTIQTVKEIAIGLSIGLLFGSAVGIWIAESRFAQRLVAPFVIMLVATPLIVFAPLLAIWFGFGIWSKVVMVVLMTFGPMAVNTMQGFGALGRDQDELMRSLCATKIEVIFKAKLPNALPAMFTGMKVSAVLSVIAVVSAEFVGATKGLGYTVYYAQSLAQSDLLIAAALLLILIGLALFYAIDWLSRRVVYWQ